MTQKIGKGVVPPAKLTDIIKDLYENEKLKNQDGTKVKYSFSRVKLTAEQKVLLTYPSVFHPLDVFVLYQVDVLKDDIVVSSEIKLVSFVKKTDAFIYGYYFSVSNQPRYDIDKLIKSKKSVELVSGCAFTVMNYLEVYNNVNGITTILGFDSYNNVASTQFAHDSRYYYQDLINIGVIDTTIPETKLIGLSTNLRHLVKKLD